MKAFITQMILMAVAVLFLLKGGFSLLIGAWRMVLPVVLLGGGYYLLKKAMGSKKSLGGKPKSSRVDAPEGAQKAQAGAEEKVIEICPHCLAEVGSCAKCRPRKFF